MKYLPWALAALLSLALPNAAAEPDPGSQSDTVVQLEGRLHVAEKLDWTFADNATYDGVARFQAPASISNLSVTLQQGTQALTVPASAVQKGASAEGLDAYRVDLTSVQPNIADGANYSVLVEYDVTGSTLRLRTTYASGTLTLFARPLDGWAVTSDYFTEWVPSGPSMLHAAKQNVPANQTYAVSFERDEAAASSRDQTPLVWGVGGLVAGLLLMLVALRMGWVSSRPRAKYEKGGSMESRTMLEARRRTLLAALKELEQAHEAKEVPDDAYAPLKEEYKAQAVRVMRNLEEKRET